MVQCKSCQAYLWNEETLSKEKDSNKQLWDCEFCGTTNSVPKNIHLPKQINSSSSTTNDNSNSNNNNNISGSSNSTDIRMIDYVVVGPKGSSSSSSGGGEITNEKKPKKEVSADDDSLVIFCVDTSGSMASTTTLPKGHGLVKIKVRDSFIRRREGII